MKWPHTDRGRVNRNFELYKRVTDDERFGTFFKDELYKRYRRQIRIRRQGRCSRQSLTRWSMRS
jgi:hypothetical protein